VDGSGFFGFLGLVSPGPLGSRARSSVGRELV